MPRAAPQSDLEKAAPKASKRAGFFLRRKKTTPTPTATPDALTAAVPTKPVVQPPAAAAAVKKYAPKLKFLERNFTRSDNCVKL